jgi:hypothetical protein
MGGYFSADDMVRKIDPVVYGWDSMIAGNDISPATPIIARVKESRESLPCGETLKGMTEAFKSAYKAQRLESIEDEILGPLGFTWETFRANARTQLSERTYDLAIDHIKNYELDLTFLVSGFDANKEAHIFTTSNPGKCEFHDKVGFWAIGSGQHQALASLFSIGYRRHDPLEHCIAKVLIAKLAAESAAGVGKTTWLMVELPPVSGSVQKALHMFPETTDYFREKWKEIPTLPSDGMARIVQNIKEERERNKAGKKVGE